MAPRRQERITSAGSLWLEHSQHTAEKKERNPPSDHSGLVLKSGFQPSFQPYNCTQRKNQNLRTQTGRFTLKKKGNELRNNSLSNLLLKLQACRSHSFFRFCFLPPHPSPFCHTVRARLSLAVTVGSPGSGNPSTKPHEFPGTTYPGQRGSSRPKSQVPSPPGKRTPFRLTKLARLHAKQGLSPLCSRTSDEETLPLSDHDFAVAVRLPLDPDALPVATKCKPIKAHALCVSARTKGLNCTSSGRAKGSFLMRNEKSSPCACTSSGRSRSWMLCASAQHPMGPGKTRRLPNKALPTSFAKSSRQRCCKPLRRQQAVKPNANPRRD